MSLGLFNVFGTPTKRALTLGTDLSRERDVHPLRYNAYLMEELGSVRVEIQMS